MPMSPQRAELLAELLKELADDPKGFIPDNAWYAVQKAFALPYIELAVVRLKLGVPQILLAHRNDAHWSGWHVPGGLWRTNATLETCIDAIAKTELGATASVGLFKKGSWEKWHNHPYGNPISHLAICIGTGIVERDDLQWRTGIPQETIDDGGHHAAYITEALRVARLLK